MADAKTYRHNATGLVSKLEAGIAAVFSHVLTEVKPDAKPLAYLPIPAEAIADLAEANDSPETPTTDEGAPTDAPTIDEKAK